MIHVIATVRLKAGKRDDFLVEFHKLVPLVRAETGCVEYGPTVDADTDIASQEHVGEDAVVVVERWESLDALKAHLVADHMTAYRQRVKDWVLATQLQILESA